MGNSSSTAANTANAQTSETGRSSQPNSPAVSGPTTREPSFYNTPSRPQPHKSLRTKKKSIELPDLAALALTPAIATHNQNQQRTSSSSGAFYSYRRPPAPPQTSSPIPIPLSPNASRQRPQTTFDSSTQIAEDQVTPTQREGRKGRPPHITKGSTQQQQTHHQRNQQQNYQTQPREHEQHQRQQHQVHHRPSRQTFQPETVHSTIPLALGKALLSSELPVANQSTVSLPAEEEPMPVVITWRGPAKSVILARAGDNDWKGRQPLAPSASDPDVWTTTIHVLPGTHHIRFLVDEKWMTAEDLPTAVDDEGSLANYVAVAVFTPPDSNSPLPTSGGGSTVTTPTGTVNPKEFAAMLNNNTSASAPMPPNANSAAPRAHSFWSTTSSSATGPSANFSYHGPGRWTSEVPRELIVAAREEEAYLAASAAAGSYGDPPKAPNVPSATVLPRHLDKLILNVRPSAVVASATSRSTRETGVSPSSAPTGGRRGSVSTNSPSNNPNSQTQNVAVNGEAALGALARLNGPGLIDDSTVLPVPNHVVLHHLCTSAIRNGVLAVAVSMRYRKKFLTTVYYKPT